MRGTRLADLRVPPGWRVAVLLGLVLGLIQRRRQLRELERIGSELGAYVGTRNREADERAKLLLKLNWALIVLTAGVLVAGVAAVVVTLAS